MNSLEDLINTLAEKKIIKNPLIKKAFLSVDRANFVLSQYLPYCYEDRPLPINEGQTISQPRTVAFMLELLQPEPGHKILDVGSGSGYTTALLAEIVGSEGQVFAIERINLLKEIGENNLKNFFFGNVSFRSGNGAQGWPEHAPFDRILVNASASLVPEQLKNQLKDKGKLVIPLKNFYGHMLLLEKISDNNYEEHLYPGFSFVPFIDEPYEN